MLKKDIGKRIKFFRELQGLTQQELARLLDVSVETVYNCEAGRKMSLNLLDKLSQKLKIPIVDFFKNEQDKRSKIYYEIEMLCKNKTEKELIYVRDMIKLMKEL